VGDGLNLAAAPPSAAPASTPRSRRRLVALAAACVVALLLLYASDVYRAHWLGGQVEQFRAAEAARGGFERRLATAKYLDRNNVTALRVLDAVSTAAPPEVMVTSLSYTRGGNLRLTGTLGNAAELEGFLRQLQATRIMTGVELRSARIDQSSRQCTFEIAAGLASYAPPAPAPAVVPPPVKADGAAAPKSPRETKPTTPTTKPGTPTTQPARTTRGSVPGAESSERRGLTPSEAGERGAGGVEPSRAVGQPRGSVPVCSEDSTNGDRPLGGGA
jgi:hypothetical protein